MRDLFQKRFDELLADATKLESTKHMENSEFLGNAEYIDNNLLVTWKVKVKDLLTKLCGNDSEQFKAFCEKENPKYMATNYSIFKDLQAVLIATKEDYENGYP